MLMRATFGKTRWPTPEQPQFMGPAGQLGQSVARLSAKRPEMFILSLNPLHKFQLLDGHSEESVWGVPNGDRHDQVSGYRT